MFDTSIYQQRPALQQKDPLESIGQALTLRSLLEQRKLQAAQIEHANMANTQLSRQISQDEQLRQHFAQNPDLEKALPGVFAIDPARGIALSKSLKEQQAAAVDLQIKKTTAAKGAAERLGSLAGSSTPETFAANVQTAVTEGLLKPEFGQQLLQGGYQAAAPQLKAWQGAAMDAAQQHSAALADLENTRKQLEADQKAAMFPDQYTKSAAEAQTAVLEAKGQKPIQPAEQAHIDATRDNNNAMSKYRNTRLGIAQKKEARDEQLHSLVMGAANGGQENPVARGMAEYRVPPLSTRSMQSPAGQSLMRQVIAINPAYDATQFPTRSKMRIAFSSGPQSQTINSLNTAIEHLDQFVNVADALGNGSLFRPGNQAYNWLRTTFGDSAPTNFQGMKTIMAGELAAAFKKSGATDQEIHAVTSAIESQNSPQQLRDYALKIAVPALGSKVSSFQSQFRQVMGENDPFQVLSPGAKAVLQKHGVNPDHPTMGGGAAAQISVKAPNGKTYVFDSQAKADAFKRAAGIQ